MGETLHPTATAQNQNRSVVSQQNTTGEFLQTSERYRCLSMLVARHVVDHKQDYQAQDQQTQPQPHLGAAAAPVTILQNQVDSVITHTEASFRELRWYTTSEPLAH
jgi:hypothetical protein